MRLPVLVLVPLLIAGCVADEGNGEGGTPSPEPTAVDSPDWAVRALPLDHDHGDPTLHEGLSSGNWEVEGWDALATDYHSAPSGGYYCGEVSEGERRLAVVNSFTSNTAIAVVDVTDPADVRLVGELVLPNAHVYDSAITDDGRYAVLATSPLDPLYEDPQDPTGVPAGAGADAGAQPRTAPVAKPSGDEATGLFWRDACGTVQVDDTPYASGVVLVDLTEPEQPSVADFRPRPALGPHSVSSTTIDGTRWVVASTTNLAYDASFFSFFHVEELPAVGGRLVEQGEYRADYEQDALADPGSRAEHAGLLNGHVDASLSKHPVTGEVIAYLANWDSGLLVVRVDGAGQFELLSRWGQRDPSLGNGMSGAIHTALPLEELWHDRAVVVTGQELGGRPAGRPTGQIVILDVTDPAAPEPLARWTLPVDIQWSGGLIFSTHYVALQDDVLYTALYHGGVWAADASPEQWPELPSLGVFLPDRHEEAGEAATCGLTPEVLDVLGLGEGRVLIFDSCTGAYVLELDREADVPVALPWTEDAWIGRG